MATIKENRAKSRREYNNRFYFQYLIVIRCITFINNIITRMIQCQAELIKRLDINIILTYDEKYLVA